MRGWWTHDGGPGSRRCGGRTGLRRRSASSPFKRHLSRPILLSWHPRAPEPALVRRQPRHSCQPRCRLHAPGPSEQCLQQWGHDSRPRGVAWSQLRDDETSRLKSRWREPGHLKLPPLSCNLTRTWSTATRYESAPNTLTQGSVCTPPPVPRRRRWSSGSGVNRPLPAHMTSGSVSCPGLVAPNLRSRPWPWWDLLSLGGSHGHRWPGWISGMPVMALEIRLSPRRGHWHGALLNFETEVGLRGAKGPCQ